MSRKKKDGGKHEPRRGHSSDDNLDDLLNMDISEARVQSQNPPMGTPRYRDPENPFNTWSGKGRRPDWFREQLDKGIAPEQMEIDDGHE